LDPTLSVDGSSGRIINMLLSGLVEETPDANIVPGIAQNWAIQEEGRKYTFYLRDDACWADGTPLTADDFAFAWKRTLNPQTKSHTATLLYDIKGAQSFHQGEITDPDELGIRVVDRHTLAVELEEPVAYFLQLLTHTAFYPIPRHVVEAHGEAWTEMENFVGNGRLILESWQRGEKMSFVRNPRYHAHFDGNLERLELFPIDDRSTRMAMYDADELDVIVAGYLTPAETDWVRQRHAGEYISQPAPFTTYLGFHTTRPPFDDVRVRQAFVLAADREALTRMAAGEESIPATGGLVPPALPGHVPGIAWPYDPERARQLLAEAGYPGGAGFPVVEAWVSSASPVHEYQIAQWCKELGVELHLKAMEWGAYLQRLAQTPPGIFVMGWTADYPDPDSFLRVGMADAQRYTHWHHDEYERLVERARRVMDRQKRLDLYRQAEMILHDQVPLFPITYVRFHLLTKPWVSRFPISILQGARWQEVVIEEH
jgi:ABC-type oligopeptide transport system substrate-binding subunit